jgi:uncharacterized metal-binding protein
MVAVKSKKWSFPNKVVVAPCTGMGQTAGTISRQAAYRVVEQLSPEDTVLLCLPAYNVNVEEDVEMVTQNAGRVIVIEGCANLCMTKVLKAKGHTPDVTVMIPRIVAKKGLRLERSKNRSRLTEMEENIASAVAEEVVDKVKSLKSR